MKTVVKEQFEANPSTNISDISDSVITKRFTKMCLDNKLVGAPILTCENKDNASDFRGQILENSYLTMRSQLITIAEKYSNSFNKKKVVVEAGIPGALAVGAVTIALLGAAARTIEAFSNACNHRCGTLRLKTSAKKGCMLKCKIQTQQKIISSLRQQASQTNNIRARKRFASDVKRSQLKMTQYQRKLSKLTSKRDGADDVDASERGRIY
jgi:hypothetical protein